MRSRIRQLSHPLPNHPCAPPAQTLRRKRTKGAQQNIFRCAPFKIGKFVVAIVCKQLPPQNLTQFRTDFLALLYQSQSLPKLPPHFAKCGGNQRREDLVYFLLFHLHTHKERGRELAICAFFRCNYSFNPAVFSRRKRKLKIVL